MMQQFFVTNIRATIYKLVIRLLFSRIFKQELAWLTSVCGNENVFI
jgi:hypothetical protein